MMERLVPEFLKKRIKHFLLSLVEDEIRQLHASQVSDTDVLLKQIVSILHYEQNIPLPPPKHLQVRVVGVYAPEFIDSGFEICKDLNCVLKAVDKELKDFQVILDFGCGCGRSIRALHTLMPSSSLSGMDIDQEAIGWLENNYASFGKFSVAPHLPPTALGDHRFDLVIGISVFTHLPEDMQFLWLEELRRITKPLGFLVLTTHGKKHYKDLSPEIVSVMENKGFYYSDFGFNYGRSISLPDFYQTTFHSHEYIRREWGKIFDVLDIQTLRMGNHQDTVLLRNRG